jgi:PKD repeat protein
MKTNILYILISVLIAAGCGKRKEYPKPTTVGESPFRSQVVVNGQALSLEAGKEGYYMFSSCAKDSSGVFNLTGEMKQPGCTTCGNSLRIQINDVQSDPVASTVKIDSTLKPGFYQFLKGSSDIGYTVKFAGSANKPGSVFSWDFGDGTGSAEMNPMHSFRIGKYKVTLTIVSPDQSVSSISNTISVTSLSDLNCFIAASVTGNTVSFSAQPRGGTSPYTYAWEFGDGSKSTGAAPTHNYAVKGGYIVKLKLTDAGGNSSTCYYNIVAGNDPYATTANFTASEFSAKAVRVSAGKAIIRFTDADGTAYTSDDPSLPGSAALRILSVEDFQNNEKGDRVKKVTLVFNCTLFNGSRMLTLDGQEVVFAFAYK